MKNLSDILFIVQARLSSQRVPNKMIREFANTTLVDIILRKIKDSIIPPKQFYFSVYEEQLKNLARHHDVQIFHRSEKSALSEGTPLTDIYEWYKLPYKYVILISGCNPLLRVQTINNFINTFLTTESEGLFGVFPKKTYFWNSNLDCITPFAPNEVLMNTKTVEPLYEAAHCLYASRMDLIPQGKFMGAFKKNDPALFLMNELECFDIDYEWQFDVAEILYLQRLKQIEYTGI